MATAIDSDIESQLIDAKVADIRESGDHGFSIFSPGDSEVAGALEGGKMAYTSTNSGRATLYRQDTGEKIQIPVNMLSKTLRKKGEDGERVFDVNPPAGVTYQLGSTLCLFHPDHPNRATYDQIGLRGRVCMSAHLASEYDAMIHAQHRHGQWWKVAEMAETRAREEAAARRQQEQTDAMLALATAPRSNLGG